MNSIISQKTYFRNLLLKHVLVILTFLVLTLVVTFPVILTFGTEAAGADCFDKCHMMWRIWWADFSFENNLDFYHSQYIFYPNGVSISGNLAQFTTGLGVILYGALGATLTWNVIWLSSFVFGGYGAFLLANHFTKNSYASIIAGVIFTFGTYHIVHAQFHIGLSMIVWLPVFTLILFKILQENSKKLVLVGGAFLFLASITHLYFFVMLVMFSIIFFIVYIFKEKDVPNRTFITNFIIILGIGIIASLIMLTPVLGSEYEYEERSLDEHIMFSTGLANLVMPTFYNSHQTFSDDGDYSNDYWFMVQINYLLNEDTKAVSSIESLSYLGYSVIVLSIFALKFRVKFSWFWVLIGSTFALLSLGPELKIINNLTGILMPERILFDYVPGWDEFRSSGRFVVMTHLSMGVLSSFAINGIMKSKMFSKKILTVIVIGIFLVVIFDVSAIPYPTYTEPIPEIYADIKKDNSKFVILELPLGTEGKTIPNSHPIFQYYQTYHEKPIIGGYESRLTSDELVQADAYFLKNFQSSQNNMDIIKQDLTKHGISILNHLNIKYVILHKDYPKMWIDHTTQREQFESGKDMSQIGRQFESGYLTSVENMMSDIVNNDDKFFEDEHLMMWKIPNSKNLEPFLLLGDGWHKFDSNKNFRAMYSESFVKIINPKNDNVDYSMKMDLTGYKQNRNVKIFFNGEYLQEYRIVSDATTRLELNELILSPGENIISIKSDGYDAWLDSNFNKKQKISLIGFSISEN